MNLLQAIEQAGDNWFRPVGVHGGAFAFNNNMLCYTDGKICNYSISLLKQNLICEWEIVTPVKVLGERK